MEQVQDHVQLLAYFSTTNAAMCCYVTVLHMVNFKPKHDISCYSLGLCVVLVACTGDS